MLPGEIHTPGWIKISVFVFVFLLKVEIYTHQAGFKIILTPNWCLLSLPDAALIDEAINPPNRIKTLNVQFTPHEIKSAHLYCKRKLFSLIKKLNLWEWIKHYASLHSLQLVSVTATIKFHIEIRPHSDNPISDQIWNPHELLWSIYLTKSVANCLIFRIRKVLGGLNNSYLAISPCINSGKQITNAQFNLQSALLTCLETWTMSPKLGLLNPIMIPYQLQRIQPSLAFIIGKARQRVRPQFRWFGFPLSSISLKLNGNNKGHF